MKCLKPFKHAIPGEHYWVKVCEDLDGPYLVVYWDHINAVSHCDDLECFDCYDNYLVKKATAHVILKDTNND